MSRIATLTFPGEQPFPKFTATDIGRAAMWGNQLKQGGWTDSYKGPPFNPSNIDPPHMPLFVAIWQYLKQNGANNGGTIPPLEYALIQSGALNPRWIAEYVAHWPR